MSYKLIRFIIRVFFNYFTVTDIDGREKLLNKGAYIVAANHLGVLDSALVFYFLDRQDIILIIAEKYQRNAFFRWLVGSMNAIFIDRYNADIRAMKIVIERLERGEILVMAPEGTRSPTGGLVKARPGGSYLAAKTGLPVLPVALTGTEDKELIASFRHLRRPRINIKVGQPMTFPPVEKADRQAVLQRYTDEIMCHIALMLPESYRGVYADHPLLLALERDSGAALPAYTTKVEISR
jgi:1-acyl-sn-glycerol-3-phosphate acyltransferase